MTGFSGRQAAALVNTIILIAITAHPYCARAQNDSKNAVTAPVIAPVIAPSPVTAATGTCASPQAVTPAQLYGEWQLAWEATADQRAAPSARETLRMGPNPNHADSLSGELLRGTVRIQLAGDLEDGQLSLEESADGKTISASWLGQVQPGSCGREIRGWWTADAALSLPAGQARSRAFVLRRQAGW